MKVRLALLFPPSSSSLTNLKEKKNLTKLLFFWEFYNAKIPTFSFYQLHCYCIPWETHFNNLLPFCSSFVSLVYMKSSNSNLFISFLNSILFITHFDFDPLLPVLFIKFAFCCTNWENFSTPLFCKFWGFLMMNLNSVCLL